MLFQTYSSDHRRSRVVRYVLPDRSCDAGDDDCLNVLPTSLLLRTKQHRTTAPIPPAVPCRIISLELCAA